MTDDVLQLARDMLAEAEHHGQNNRLARALLAAHEEIGRLRELIGDWKFYMERQGVDGFGRSWDMLNPSLRDRIDAAIGGEPLPHPERKDP